MAIINMIGGGGGLQSTDAILRVIAPAGSTVTISKGGVSKSDLGHENASDTSLYDYYFIIHASQFDSVNPWTVTATLGSNIDSDTIIIDVADEYDVALTYLVPPEYQAVEYIQSDGSQYINTTISAQYCSIDAQVYATEYIGDAFLLTSVSSAPRLCLVDTNGSNTRVFYNGTASEKITSGTKMPLNTIVSIQAGAKPNEQFVTVNGTRTAKTLSESPTMSGIFAILRPYASTSSCLKIRIYYLKVYDTSGNMIGELYPCYRKADSVAGLWDRVNEVFLTNAGNGSFTVGNDIN
jgi:hypothetical protein